MKNVLRHGGYSYPKDAKRVSGETADIEDAIDVASDFDYMFPTLAKDAASKLPSNKPDEVIANLKELAKVLIDNPPDSAGANSHIPTIYTYWGQFLDHDITANTDRDSGENDITVDAFTPLDPDLVTRKIKNLRRPQFDLDSVYGDGPTGDASLFYDGDKFRLGTVRTGDSIPGDLIPKEDDLARDLPRIGPLIDEGAAKEDDFPADVRGNAHFRRLPWIGDMRNDENTIIAQFHTAFLRFHNAVVDQVSKTKGDDTFTEARKLTTWHYQWLLVNDYLRRMTFPGTVDAILCGGRKFFDPKNEREFMPLEHSVAAYRFGHSMVRSAYDFNRNFGRGAQVLSNAEFSQLFRFTGRGGFETGNAESLPSNWVIEFDRFTDFGSGFSDRFARKIDTLLAPPLGNMTNALPDPPPVPDLSDRIKDILKHLAMRNLLRGYLLSIPTGQAVAAAIGAPALSEQELRQNNSAELNTILEQGGFLTKTPLWFYILKEAEVRAKGEFLGQVGSRIVAETFIGLIQKDDSSYLNKAWDPSKGVKLDNGDCIVTIRDFLTFAGLPA